MKLKLYKSVCEKMSKRFEQLDRPNFGTASCSTGLGDKMKTWQVNLKVALYGCTAEVHAETLKEAIEKTNASDFAQEIELGTGEIIDWTVLNIKEV